MFVYTNSAVTLDGRIASAGYVQPGFSSKSDLRYLSVLRARADAVLVGGRTFRNWPHASVPRPESIAALQRDGFPDAEVPSLEGRRWWNVILTRSLDLPRDCEVWGDPRVRPLIFSEQGGEFPAEVVAGPVTVPRVLAELERRGVRRLLVEAGGELIFRFLEADAVDELYVTVCPALLGGERAPTLVDGPGFTPETMRRLRLEHVNRVGDELYCRYSVLRGPRP